VIDEMVEDTVKETAAARRKQQRKKIEIRRKEFKYRGYSLEELQRLSIDDLIPILPSRARRTLKRGLTREQYKLVNDVQKAGKDDVIRTHRRDMIILPSFVGHRIDVHNGKEFQRVDIQPQMIGHYLGEFVLTRKRVKHTGPGVGATRSSKFMPLK
jgi:small subunit ribosomal protein S19